MIQKYSHVTLYVLDQNVAYDFYVTKLGFEVRMDHNMGSWRWLTVSPPAQPDLQIVLLPVMTGPTVDEAAAAIFHRRAACALMKEAAEGLHVLIADLEADFGDRQIAPQQQPACFLKPHAPQKGVRRFPEGAFEQAQVVELRDTGFAGGILQGDRLVKRVGQQIARARQAHEEFVVHQPMRALFVTLAVRHGHAL